MNEAETCRVLVRPRLEQAGWDPDFFYLWLTSPRFSGAIDPSRSNGVPHISHKDIEKLPFSPPSLEMQHRILSLANNMRAKKEEAESLTATLMLEITALIPTVLARTFFEDVV